MRGLRGNMNFWFLLVGQTGSSFGDIIYSMAIVSFAYVSTHSVMGTASLMIMSTAVRLLAGFVTIQVADRVPHRTVMIVGDVVRGVAVGTLGLISLRYELSMALLYAVTAVNAFAGAFFAPARASILPAAVTKDQLVQANGLIASSGQLVQTCAWALGGALISLVGAPVVILVNAASFLVSAVATWFIRCAAQPNESVVAKKQNPLERLKSGWREVWTNRVVRDVTIMDGLEAFANTIWSSAFMLAFTLQVLKAGQEWWGYQAAAYFVGAVAGGLIAAAASRWLSRKGGWSIALSSGGYALLTAWYALCGNPVVAVALSLVFGPIYQVRDVVQSSMLQSSVDTAVIARAFATRDLLLYAISAPAVAVMGLLADVAGTQAAYLAGAGLYAVVAVFAAMSAPIRSYKIAPAVS